LSTLRAFSLTKLKLLCSAIMIGYVVLLSNSRLRTESYLKTVKFSIAGNSVYFNWPAAHTEEQTHTCYILTSLLRNCSTRPFL